jgi:hypothetical protein
VIAAFGDHPYRCNFFSVNGCPGQTGFDNQGSVTPTISNSNFYSSTLSSAVLYIRTIRMEVVNCIFRDNTRDIGRQSDGAITVSACVFSGSKLTNTWITYTDSCAWDTRTNSHALCHARTSACPADPCRTATPSPFSTPTAAFAPSPIFPAAFLSFLPNRTVRPAPLHRPAQGHGPVPSQRRRRCVHHTGWGFFGHSWAEFCRFCLRQLDLVRPGHAVFVPQVFMT